MFRPLNEQDHYQVLEVPYDASAEQIQSAYENARDIYSHDALVSGTILSEHERRRTFDRIAEAYQTLIAEESRRLYDERIGIPRQSPRTPRGRDLSSAPDSKPREVLERSQAVEPSQESEPVQPPRPERRECPIQLRPAEEASGEFLRRAREALGLEIATISEETKIGSAMIEYIEQERVERLPAPVYLKNFTRQVARCLGLDEDRVSKSYLDRIRRVSG